MSTITNDQPTRSCNGCTKCCEGWLSCNVYGHEVKPGKACFYLKNETCSIYNTRPVTPCRNFECAWLADPELIPEKFWPGSSNIIMVTRTSAQGHPYMAFHEAGGSISVEILDWAAQSVQYGSLQTIIYTVNGEKKILSSNKEFIDEMYITPNINDNTIE